MNRRSLIKSAVFLPIGFVFGRAAKAEEILEEKFSMWENHYWRGPNGEHMKVERLADAEDAYNFMFAVYPKEIIGKPFYTRIELAKSFVRREPRLAQIEYEKQVARSVSGYLGNWTLSDMSLSMYPETWAKEIDRLST